MLLIGILAMGFGAGAGAGAAAGAGGLAVGVGGGVVSVVCGGLLFAIALVTCCLWAMWEVAERMEAQAARHLTELAAARATQEGAIRAKKEFLGCISHEIRTPINGIIGMLQLLVEECELDQDQRDAIDTALLSCWTLTDWLAKFVYSESPLNLAWYSGAGNQPLQAMVCVNDGEGPDARSGAAGAAAAAAAAETREDVGYVSGDSSYASGAGGYVSGDGGYVSGGDGGYTSSSSTGGRGVAGSRFGAGSSTSSSQHSDGVKLGRMGKYRMGSSHSTSSLPCSIVSKAKVVMGDSSGGRAAGNARVAAGDSGGFGSVSMSKAATDGSDGSRIVSNAGDSGISMSRAATCDSSSSRTVSKTKVPLGNNSIICLARAATGDSSGSRAVNKGSQSWNEGRSFETSQESATGGSSGSRAVNKGSQSWNEGRRREREGYPSVTHLSAPGAAVSSREVCVREGTAGEGAAGEDLWGGGEVVPVSGLAATPSSWSSEMDLLIGGSWGGDGGRGESSVRTWEGDGGKQDVKDGRENGEEGEEGEEEVGDGEKGEEVEMRRAKTLEADWSGRQGGRRGVTFAEADEGERAGEEGGGRVRERRLGSRSRFPDMVLAERQHGAMEQHHGAMEQHHGAMDPPTGSTHLGVTDGYMSSPGSTASWSSSRSQAQSHRFPSPSGTWSPAAPTASLPTAAAPSAIAPSASPSSSPSSSPFSRAFVPPSTLTPAHAAPAPSGRDLLTALSPRFTHSAALPVSFASTAPSPTAFSPSHISHLSVSAAVPATDAVAAHARVEASAAGVVATADVASGARQVDEPSQAPAPPLSPRSLTARLRGRRVLVVDDNAVNRKVVLAKLRPYGMVGVQAENGRVAVERFIEGMNGSGDGGAADGGGSGEGGEGGGAEGFVCVFMDLQMPVMDGYDATIEIRQLEEQMGRHRVPIFAITADIVAGAPERCQEIGMNGFMTKPLSNDQLKASLAVVAANV
ncbi:unnamed protein product [Closterium sp. Yama58-4]|nr:unnamed protein product [Closterium sp. Yama58-4]